jgi:hypothetical protein
VTTARRVGNFVAFQCGWFACVICAAHGRPLLGTAAVLLVAALHVGLAARPRAELALLACAALVGLIFDSALAASGWVRYSSGVLLEGTAPYWIVAMWVLFATTLNVSLAWLHAHARLAAAFGAVGGPLSFVAGARLGALAFANEPAALAALATGWALATPLLLRIAANFNGYAPRGTRAFRLSTRDA